MNAGRPGMECSSSTAGGCPERLPGLATAACAHPPILQSHFLAGVLCGKATQNPACKPQCRAPSTSCCAWLSSARNNADRQDGQDSVQTAGGPGSPPCWLSGCLAGWLGISQSVQPCRAGKGRSSILACIQLLFQSCSAPSALLPTSPPLPASPRTFRVRLQRSACPWAQAGMQRSKEAADACGRVRGAAQPLQ